MTISSVVGGTAGFQKTGSGSLILSATNTVSGAVTFSGGVTNLNTNTGKLNSATSVNVESGAKLVLDNSGATTTAGDLFDRLSSSAPLNMKGGELLFRSADVSPGASFQTVTLSLNQGQSTISLTPTGTQRQTARTDAAPKPTGREAEVEDEDSVHIDGIPPEPPESLLFPERISPDTSGLNVISGALPILNGNGNGYAGIDAVHNGGYEPPDTAGAAGPSCYVESVNLEITIYSPKGTGATAVMDNGDHFFHTVGGLPYASANSRLIDLSMSYDELIGRFVMVVIDEDSTFNGTNPFYSYLLVAASKSSNPTTLTSADWNFYYIDTTELNKFTDYPGNLGYNADAFIVTLNMFGAPNGHEQIVAINASDLANGVTQASLHYYRTDTATGVLLGRSTTMHGSLPGDPMWFVESEGGFNSRLDVTKMSNVLSSSPTLTTTTLTVNSYGDPPPMLNPDGTDTGRAPYARMQKLAGANGTLVATHVVGIYASPNSGTTQSTIRWYVFDVSTGTPALRDQGEVSGGNNTYLDYPAIDVNSAGYVGLTYMRSGNDSPNDYLSMYVTGRAPTDPPGTMRTSVLVPAGTGKNNYKDSAFRLGDISGIHVDPSDGSFWAVNQWATSTPGVPANGNWSTAIANFVVTYIRAQNAQKASNNFTETFGNLINGLSYRLERSDTLVANSWSSIGGVSDFTANANAASGQISDPSATGTKHFYRVRILP